MVCPACGLPNDPASSVCARCNATLVSSAGPVATTTVHPGRPPRRTHWPLIAGVAVLVAVVALYLAARKPAAPEAAFVPPAAETTGATTADQATTDPTATGDPQQQAATVDSVLSASVESRAKLNDAIQRIGSCTDVEGAVSDMRNVGTERELQIDTIRNADLSALPSGEDLRTGLVTALTYALQADQGFLGWAEPTTTDGCADTTSRTQAYTEGRNASQQAGDAKRRFLALWNPVATDNGLNSRSADDI